MSGIELYRGSGLEIYERAHYSHGEHIAEVEAILSWYDRRKSRVLDLGCSGGLHALELAKRGHRVTGLDVEETAIVLARKRSSAAGLAAEFFVADLEAGGLAGLGSFDLVYSLGNVISHIPNKSLPGLLKGVRSCMAPDGTFLFDILVIGDPFPERICERDLGIRWERRLEPASGEIFLKGIFERFGVTQEFRVWGRGKEEMTGMLRGAGFTGIEVSPSLDFATALKGAESPACLRFRARPEEVK